MKKTCAECEKDETPAMEAEAHPKGFLKRAAKMAATKRSGKKAKKTARKHVSVKREG